VIKRIDHVVVAVRDLEAGIQAWQRALGLGEPSRRSTDSRVGYTAAAFDLPGGGFLELIQPIDSSGPVARRLERSGEGVYLVALAVEDLGSAVAQLRQRGVEVIEDGGQVFIHPRATNGVLFQLVQRAG
jgi:methylmalonyl-CoA/ethylmalonyl-CoA epimerase